MIFRPFPHASVLPVLALVYILGLSGISLRAQGADGFTVQERPGLALVKPQAWSQPQEATALEFIAFTDRTVQGTPGAGYYEFQTKQANKRQVPAGRVVKLIIYPQVDNYSEILTAEDRATVVAVVEELKSSLAQYPAARTYLDPSIKAFDAELARYDGGEVKIKGEWQAKESYYTKQISSLGSQLRLEIIQAKPPSSFDLQGDQRYVGLKELAGTSSSAGKLAGELVALHDKLVRAEQRDALLVQLSSATISLSEAEGAAGRLQALQPEEDPRSVAFLKKWQSGLAAMRAMNEAAKPLAASMEGEMEEVVEVKEVPQISEDLSAKIQNLNEQVRPFEAAQPVPVLSMAARPAIAVSRVDGGFKKLAGLIAGKQYLQAKDNIDSLSAQATYVGPQTARVISELQRNAAARIEQFSKLREEAGLLLQSGKPDQALPKFQQALDVMADPAVAEQVAALQKALPPQ